LNNSKKVPNPGKENSTVSERVNMTKPRPSNASKVAALVTKKQRMLTERNNESFGNQSLSERPSIQVANRKPIFK
jgi:hypothetical protein